MTTFLVTFGGPALIVGLASWRQLAAAVLSGRPLPADPICHCPGDVHEGDCGRSDW